MINCPKCGAIKSHKDVLTFWMCGSRSSGLYMAQSDACRIKELEIEVERLQDAIGDLEDECDSLRAEIETLEAEDGT